MNCWELEYINILLLILEVLLVILVKNFSFVIKIVFEGHAFTILFKVVNRIKSGYNSSLISCLGHTSVTIMCLLQQYFIFKDVVLIYLYRHHQ